jgi:hypothetical protein
VIEQINFMSEEQKEVVETIDEMTRLKRLWASMPPEERAELRVILESGKGDSVICVMIKQRLNIDLPYAHYITRFREWLLAQEARDLKAEKNEKRQAELRAQGLSLVEAQVTILREAAEHVLSEEDYTLGTRISAEITRVRSLALDREKFEYKASKACLAMLPELIPLYEDDSIEEDEKIRQVRLKLFGSAPL